MNNIAEVRIKIALLRAELKSLEVNLEQGEKTCHHDWGEVVYDPEYYPGYRVEGDPPGVGGVDHRFPFYVESKTVPKWKRVCHKCGKTEITTKTKTEVKETKHPVF